MNGTFGSTVLDVAMGLSFIYLALAVVCTVVNEWISGFFNTRGKMLQRAIQQLLDNQLAPPMATAPAQQAALAGGAQPGAAPAGDAPAASAVAAPAPGNPNGFLDLFYQHPLMTGMRQPGRHQAYLSSDTFAKVVLDVAAGGKTGIVAAQGMEAGIQGLPDGDVKKALLALTQTAGQDLAQAETNIKAWFEDSMDRVSGWYKRTVQIWTLAIALALALALNADTLRIGKDLWQDTAVRSAIVAQAHARVAKDSGATAGLTVEEQKALGQLLGWEKKKPDCWWTWGTWGFGVLLTTAAVSLGAPFWFDALKRFVNLRPAGKSPPGKPAK